MGAPLVKRLCVLTTTDIIVRFFLRDLLRALGERYELTLVVNTRDARLLEGFGVRGRLVPLAIEREIAPLADLRALLGLRRILADGRFDGIVTLAPKAGLLGALAAWQAGVGFRCHVFQGEVWATARGMRRALLRGLDRLVARLSTHLLVISESERRFLEEERVVAPGAATLIADGSLAGVDLERFHADPQARTAIRRELGLEATGFVVLFLGRLKRDKGVLDLARAFGALARENPDAALLFVGPDEDALAGELKRAAAPHAARLRFVPLTADPQRYLAAADVVALPSFREGFGNVLIEAGATGLPVVASRIYGVECAVSEGVTGLLHPPGDAAAIAAHLSLLAGDAARRRQLGEGGLERARTLFDRRRVEAFWLAFLGAAMGETPGKAR